MTKASDWQSMESAPQPELKEPYGPIVELRLPGGDVAKARYVHPDEWCDIVTWGGWQRIEEDGAPENSPQPLQPDAWRPAGP